jgi:hypothetical protein
VNWLPPPIDDHPLQVPSGAWETTHNSYGFMRAPWNNNNSPYVTRTSLTCGADFIDSIMGVPTCVANYNLLFNTQYATFEDFAWFMPGAPHGPVHILSGGIFNCEVRAEERMAGVALQWVAGWLLVWYIGSSGLLPMAIRTSFYKRRRVTIPIMPQPPPKTRVLLTAPVTAPQDSYDSLLEAGFESDHVTTLKFTSFVAMKNFYRAGLTTCPDSCDADTPLNDCQCTCANVEQVR